MLIIALDIWGTVGDEGYYHEPDIEGDAQDLTNISDDQGAVQYLYADPQDLNDAYGNKVTWDFKTDIGNEIVPILPTPVDAYLEEIEWQDETNASYSSNGKSITYKGIIGQDIDNKDIKGIRKMSFNTDGFLENYQILTDDNEILVELGTKSLIPGYDLPIFLGILSLSAVGLIYAIIKQ
jgi:hypothetical protein